MFYYVESPRLVPGLDQMIRPQIFPGDEVMERFAGPPVPRDEGAALCGQAEGFDVRCMGA